MNKDMLRVFVLGTAKMTIDRSWDMIFKGMRRPSWWYLYIVLVVAMLFDFVPAFALVVAAQLVHFGAWLFMKQQYKEFKETLRGHETSVDISQKTVRPK